MWWFWWFLAPIGALARRIGECLGIGLARIVGEADYLTQRTRTASPAERSAWLLRCTVSCLIVIGECALLMLFKVRVDNPLTVVVASAAILLLPTPTPRVPLIIARILAVVFTMTNLAGLYDLIKSKLPAFQSYGVVIGFCGFAIWVTLSIWALSPLWLSKRRDVRSPQPTPRFPVFQGGRRVDRHASRASG
jgi:hypothetical protein